MAASETTTHTEQPGGHPAFPPFQKETYPAQLLWFVLVFVALYLVMARVALPRIGGILADRQARIDGDLAEAQRLKDASDAALAAYEKSLADARGRAQSLANESRQREAVTAGAQRKALESTLNAHIARAEGTIAERRTAAMANVRGIAADTAAAIIEHLIGTAAPAPEVDAAVAAVLKH